jgi:glycosyltransferase involved in cell wall biosynthesis
VKRGAASARAASEGALRVLLSSTHSYPPQRVGGIELNSHELCLELRRSGHVPAVLATLEPKGRIGLTNRIRRKLPGGPLFPADRVMGYPVYRGWDVTEGAAEVMRRFRPDVGIAQGSGPVPLAKALLATGLPTVLYLHDVEFDRLDGDIPDDPRLLVLANSRFTARRAERELGVQAEVIPPLIRPEQYQVSTRRERVVFINPHPLKGVETALRLAESRPDIPFVFVESWALRPDRRKEYGDRAARLPNVEWRASSPDMREVYRHARLVLAPSIWEEAWGRIVTEAQVSGIPVLASDRGGLPESVGPGGVLVDPAAPPERWVEALSRVWDDPAEYERLSAAALDHARRPEIQPGVIVTRFVDILSRHAGRESPPGGELSLTGPGDGRGGAP